MGISDAFLRGQQVATQAQNQKLGILNALIRRPTTRAPAVRYGGNVGGGGSAIESFEDREARQAEEGRKARKDERLEEVHTKAMEIGELETDILDQALSEKETAAAYKAEDRAKLAAEDVTAGRIRETAREDTEAYQEQMRHYRAYSDAIYRGDATAADRHFKGVYPGMGETSRTTVKRQQRDEKGNLMVDEQGAPVMEETRYGPAGEKMTEEEYQAKQVGYPKHRSDGGVVYMQFGDQTPVPVGPGRLRQVLASVHQSMMTPTGGGAGGAEAKPISAKDRSHIALNQAKKGAAIVATGLKVADSMPIELEEGETLDPYNPREKSAEQFQRDLVTGMGIVAKLSGTPQAKAAGLGTAVKALGPQASKQFANKSREWYDDQAIKPDIRQMIEMARRDHGLGVAHEMTKKFKAELTPGELDFKAENPKKTPDFGRGEGNVVSIFDKDIGKDGFSFAIDKDLKRPMRWDKQKRAWTAMEPSTLKAYYNMLQTKARGGDKKAQEVIQLLEAKRMTPFSIADLSKSIGEAALRAGSAISDAVSGEWESMKQWTGQQEPEQPGLRTDISQSGQ